MEEQQYELVEENTNLKQQLEDLKDSLKLRFQLDEDTNHALANNIARMKVDVSENNVMINENLQKIDSIEHKFDEMHENLEGSKQRGNVLIFFIKSGN